MPWRDSVDAILEMWYPGQEGGTATADTLYGVSDPSGKLTMTFPTNSSETLFAGHPERAGGTQPQGEQTRTIKWTEGLDVGYRWYASADDSQGFAPMYAFGHGLSYTRYRYDDVAARATDDGGIDVDVRITDVGGAAGAEIPQVYVGPSARLPGDIAQAPVKLVQFDRVALAPGESTSLTMHVAPRELSSWSESAGGWVLGTGPRTVSVGAASDDIRGTATVDVAAASAPGGTSTVAEQGQSPVRPASAAAAPGTPAAPAAMESRVPAEPQIVGNAITRRVPRSEERRGSSGRPGSSAVRRPAAATSRARRGGAGPGRRRR